MEIKKSRKADLEHSRLTGFLLGLAIALSLFITAIEFNSGAGSDDTKAQPLDHLVKDLSIPAVDEQDREASKPRTSLRNEITSTRENPETVVQQEADAPTVEAAEAPQEQAGQGEQQLATVREAEQTETAVAEPQEQTVAAPPAPLDPVEPAKDNATNLPVPPGGWAEFNKWMGQTLKYPKEAAKRKVKGDVTLAFIVNADGSLSDVKVVKPGPPALNEEVLRVAALMDKWKPGYKNHKPCRTYMELPISFNL